jgi:hypothetical protein
MASGTVTASLKCLPTSFRPRTGERITADGVSTLALSAALRSADCNRSLHMPEATTKTLRFLPLAG